MKHKVRPVINPCPWMKGLLARLVEGTLTGPLGWYARKHVDRCDKCGPAYKALLALRTGLKSLGQGKVADGLLSEDRWKAIENVCDHV